MKARQLFGLSLVGLAIIAAIGLDQIGRAQQPQSFTIDFVRGDTLADGAEVVIARVAAAMARQPRYEAVIVGHSGTRGDATANLELSRKRAEFVAARLKHEGINADRLAVHAVGGSEPLEREDGEALRRYQQRLARVEVELDYQ